jgi:hypothetical protein
MNEYNHHRIIGKFVEGKPDIDVDTLEQASDFSDDFRGIIKTKFAEDPTGVLKDTAVGITNSATGSALSAAIDSSIISGGNPVAIAIGAGVGAADSMVNSIKNDELYIELTDESQFYYYHFFYEIEVEKKTIGKGKITLKRHKKDDPAIKPEKDDLGKNAENYSDNLKLYYTAVNNREDFFLTGIAEGSNQSNCVAFLHAMGAQTKHKRFNENNPRRTFENHLKKCFAEYLYLKDETEALFMLGIALHGIMDSFTPSHTGFQVYGDQDMGLHAQGDVIPIRDSKEPKTMEFIPGQYNNETKTIMKDLARLKKGYDDDDFLNNREYEMLRSFLIISKVAYKKNNTELDINEINELCSHFKSHHVSLSKINKVLSEGFTYGESAFDYSIMTVQVLNKIYNILYTKRKEIEDFNSYKAAKSCCVEAVNVWRDEYKKIDTKTIFNQSYLNGFKPTFWTSSVGKIDNIIDRASDSINQATTTAINTASTVYQIAKDTIVGTGKALGNMAYDTQCKAVEIAKDLLNQYDQLVEENRQINPDFNMFGGSNKL